MLVFPSCVCGGLHNMSLCLCLFLVCVGEGCTMCLYACALSRFISVVLNIPSQYGDEELLDVKRPGSVDRQTLILINIYIGF